MDLGSETLRGVEAAAHPGLYYGFQNLEARFVLRVSGFGIEGIHALARVPSTENLARSLKPIIPEA